MNRLTLAPVTSADDADLNVLSSKPDTSAATIGVFPVPPAWILPTTTTGTGNFSLSDGLKQNHRAVSPQFWQTAWTMVLTAKTETDWEIANGFR